jgi:hypothetical protein
MKDVDKLLEQFNKAIANGLEYEKEMSEINIINENTKKFLTFDKLLTSNDDLRDSNILLEDNRSKYDQALKRARKIM